MSLEPVINCDWLEPEKLEYDACSLTFVKIPSSRDTRLTGFEPYLWTTAASNALFQWCESTGCWIADRLVSLDRKLVTASVLSILRRHEKHIPSAITPSRLAKVTSWRRLVPPTRLQRRCRCEHDRMRFSNMPIFRPQPRNEVRGILPLNMVCAAAQHCQAVIETAPRRSPSRLTRRSAKICSSIFNSLLTLRKAIYDGLFVHRPH